MSITAYEIIILSVVNLGLNSMTGFSYSNPDDQSGSSKSR